MPPQHLEHGEHLRDWLKELPKDATLLLDCDGTVWSGNELYNGVKEALDVLRGHGCRFGFVSNNATLSRAGYEKKFARLGLDWVKKEMIFTSGSASASWIKRNLLPELSKDANGIYLIGQKAMEEELEAEGLKWKGGTSQKDNGFLPYQDFSSIEHDRSIGVVLHAFDMHYCLTKYAKAYNYLRSNEDCRLVLTNVDEFFTANKDVYIPGEGLLGGILTNASKSEATIVGKPAQPLIDILEAKLQLDQSKTYFFGDNIAVDMAFANKAGWKSVFCLTGISKEDALKDAPDEDQPTFIIDSLGDFAALK